MQGSDRRHPRLFLVRGHSERGEDVPVKVDDHAVDALRYGVAITRALSQQRIPIAA